MRSNAVGLNADVMQTDLSRSGWSPYLGYRLNETVAVELGYVDLGTATTTINGATADVNSYLATASGWTLDLVMRKSVHECVDALFKFGALRWKADYTLASATASRKFSDTGFNGNLGIGLEMAVPRHLPDCDMQMHKIDIAAIEAARRG